jgi:hypothetical protein
MRGSFFLLTLLRAEIDRLEKLRRLESRLRLAPPAERPAIQRNIDSVMEEVDSLNRTVQKYRAGIAEIG